MAAHRAGTSDGMPPGRSGGGAQGRAQVMEC